MSDLQEKIQAIQLQLTKTNKAMRQAYEVFSNLETKSASLQIKLHKLQKAEFVQLADILPALRFAETSLGLNKAQLLKLKTELLKKKELS